MRSITYEERCADKRKKCSICLRRYKKSFRKKHLRLQPIQEVDEENRTIPIALNKAKEWKVNSAEKEIEKRPSLFTEKTGRFEMYENRKKTAY